MSDIQTDDPGAGLAIDFGFQVSAGISSLRDEVRKMRRDLQRTQAQTPVNTRRQFWAFPNNQYPAAGNLTMQIDGPQVGQVWEIRHLVVGGASATATPAGIAYLFVGNSAPLDLNLAQLQDFSSGAFPQQSYYSTGQMKLYAQENLYLVITGGTPGVTYAAYVDIEQYPDTRKMATVSIE